MREYKVSNKIHKLHFKNKTYEELVDKFIAKDYESFKKIVKCQFLSNKYYHKFWRAVFNEFPELEGKIVNYDSLTGILTVQGKAGND